MRETQIQHVVQCPGSILGIIGHNPSVSQVQPVTCCGLAIFSLLIGGIFIDSSTMTSSFPEVLNFNRLFFKLKN